MKLLCRLLYNWLMPGLALTTAILLVTKIACKEKSMMATSHVPLQVSFLGTKVSNSSFTVVTEIAYKIHDSKEWPYLSVVIFSPNGTRLYQSGQYAAWFKVRLCWDDADRLWIASNDTGTDVIASSPNGWNRFRWMPDTKTRTIIDAESGKRLNVVNWNPPNLIKGSVENEDQTKMGTED